METNMMSHILVYSDKLWDKRVANKGLKLEKIYTRFAMILMQCSKMMQYTCTKWSWSPN